MRASILALLGLLAGCASTCGESKPDAPEAPTVSFSVIGINDLHGHVESLPALAGYVKILREKQGGRVAVIDAGDMFQGTLASNLEEGAPVVAAYNAMGVTAATIGNHEFDYGPLGEDATPQNDEQDPRGALKARVAQAEFPILAANITSRDSGQRIDWEGVSPAVLVELGGVKVGVIGVTTEDTFDTTIAANVRDLVTTPLDQAVIREARSLKVQGAQVIIVTAHAGGDCESHDNANDISSCDQEDEIFRLARAIPSGLVHVIVAGHTHKTVAHFVNEIAVIESGSYGRAFGRVDLSVRGDRVLSANVRQPTPVCANTEGDGCELGQYEGQQVIADEAVATAIAPSRRRAEIARSRSLGVTLSGPLTRSYKAESALGNYLADQMRALSPESDVALLNAGGVRADIPGGELTYGALYETFPFDNRFAFVHMPARDLANLIARNLGADRGTLILSGMRAVGVCDGHELKVTLTDAAGEEVPMNRRIHIATSDYLATTRAEAFLAARARGDIQIQSGLPMRDQIAEHLTQVGGELDVASTALLDPEQPRISGPSARPVQCVVGAAGTASP